MRIDIDVETFLGWKFDAHSTQYGTMTDHSTFVDHGDAFLVPRTNYPNGPM